MTLETMNVSAFHEQAVKKQFQTAKKIFWQKTKPTIKTVLFLEVQKGHSVMTSPIHYPRYDVRVPNGPEKIHFLGVLTGFGTMHL